MSPSVLLDGPLGLEATHTINGFVINDSTVYPMVRPSKITGLHDSADFTDTRDSTSATIGEIPYPTLARGKTVTYSGDPTRAGGIIADDLMILRAIATAWRKAVVTPRDTALAIAPHPTFGGPTLTGYGRCSGLNIDDEVVLGQGRVHEEARAFVFSFRMSDPRWYDLSNPVSGSAADGASHTLTMPGNAPAEPNFAVVTAGGAVVLENTTLGLNLTFRSDLPAGTLAVVFANKTAFIGSEDVRGYIDWGVSNWWDAAAAEKHLLPGANVLKVTGGAWDVSAYPCVW